MIRPCLNLLGAGLLALTSVLAHAQYAWIDETGTRVHADRPPPPGTPPARILKAPQGLAPVAQATPAAGGQDQEALPDWQLRERDYKQRARQRAAGDEAEQTLAAQRTARQAECARARADREKLENGRRLTKTNRQGEREPVPEAERRAALARAQELLARCD